MLERRRVLVVQSWTDDPEPILRVLRQADIDPDCHCVATEHEFVASLEPPPDVILTDYQLPGWSGLHVLQIVQERGLDVPVVFLSSTRGEEPAVTALKLGAADYLLREQLHHLGGRVHEALGRRRSRNVQAEANHARLAAILEASPDLVATADPDGRILYVNAAARKLLGLPADLPVGEFHLQDFHAPQGQIVLERDALPTARSNGAWSGENTLRHVSGRNIPVWQVVLAHQAPTGDSLLSTVAHDLTDYKRLEAQFRQAQKMEAVGRLASGVAHDFNNLLTIIKGFTELLLRRLPPNDPGRSHLEQIFRAGESATLVTRQLLAFSRKQFLTPEVFSLNALLGGVSKMLTRLIGEHIELSTQLADDLRTVKADPGQIEQVVMNLVVNACDAMPTGGVLTIQTANREIDEDWRILHPEMKAREYVVLSIRDTGCGMTPETLSHLFEPFFTTKEVGKGTGLGLATVYGIVKQSGGFIYASSEVDKGSCFEIFLPPAVEKTPLAPTGGTSWINPRGHETILLVEDQDDVRHLAREALQGSGYHILEAPSPGAALELFDKRQADIDALVTDVVMPGMSGRELAERLLRARPDLKVLYMSGYTDEAVLRHGVSTNAFNMLFKPFTPSKLGRKLREVLDRQVPTLDP
jgi:PAS domain S-box-containing protein